MNKQNRKIVLEDGAVFYGNGFGSPISKKVEMVFNTSMVGYQEILSDPSYTDQAVVMTYPLIGNYGMCDEDYETLVPSISGMVVREYCELPSNFRCTRTLDDVMKEYHIVGVEGIDTRMLTRHIRDNGSMKAAIVDADMDTEEVLEELKGWVQATDQVPRVSTDRIYEYGEHYEDALHVAVIDCGIKHNILREMKRIGLNLTVVPWNTSAEEIKNLKPDGVFISNGPGDPQDADATVQTIRELIGFCPIFGICLGHQIISLAYGATTYKLKFGHRGGNHPVQNVKTGKIEITSQNHSYAVSEESLKNTPLTVSRINLLDQTIEGVECPADKVFSVQYHPESAPGPQDSGFLFDEFLAYMKLAGEEKDHAEEK